VSFAAVSWRLRTSTLTNQDHTLIMGVVNVTPDSFSDGGSFEAGRLVDHRSAIAHGIELKRQGADLVDVGGESTRPGSLGVDIDEELLRIEPVVAGLVAAGVTVSIDTSKPEVAAAAIDAGAEVVNDVTALRDPDMARICAESGVGVVLMHMQGEPAMMQIGPEYDDVIAQVSAALLSAAAAAISSGVSPDRICVDPGIGFGKTCRDNVELLNGLRRVGDATYPVLVGASRKGFLGAILEAAGHPAEAADRDAATGATVALAIAQRAAVVRVHDVASALQSARTADAILRVGHL
jgi:dihydropteroate synthase